MSKSRKRYISGKGMNYFAEAKVVEFLIENSEVNNGDEILIIGPATGVIESTFVGISANGEISIQAKKGDLLTFSLNEKIRLSDKLYKLIDNPEDNLI